MSWINKSFPLQVYLNDQAINSNTDFYQFKSYLQNLVSYNNLVKWCQLQSCGYYPDTAGHFEDFASSISGIVRRRELFRENNAYVDKEVPFIGKLLTDLSSCDTGIVPGVNVRIELVQALDQFRVMCPGSEATHKYKITITSAKLLCPVAQLSQEMFAKLEKNILKQREMLK